MAFDWLRNFESYPKAKNKIFQLIEMARMGTDEILQTYWLFFRANYMLQIIKTKYIMI
tara:strand:- start:498 stop:671 length:174 start_codon:yes stop_codon:yes gene_type:complete